MAASCASSSTAKPRPSSATVSEPNVAAGARLYHAGEDEHSAKWWITLDED